MSANQPACMERVSSTSEPAPRRQDLQQRYQKCAPGSTKEAEWVESHLPLVRTIVGRIAMTLPSHVDVEDLYSAGLVGLLNAVRNFDAKSGTSFETYARLRIRGSIIDELRRLDWVPRSVHAKARKVQAVMRELEQKNGQVVSEAQMAKAMKISLGEYQQLLDEIRPTTFICLDTAQSSENDDGPSHYESVADPSQQNPVEDASRRELSSLIADRLEQLPEIQRKVLALYYFEGLRLREIAAAFKLTESRICQIHAQAILSIKSYLNKYEAVEP
jgi:RNA polymerase sigma factor FliA